MIIRDAKGITAEVHLYDNNTGIDVVEDYLNAGTLDRDADGVYLVDNVYCLHVNQDFCCKPDANWFFERM